MEKQIASPRTPISRPVSVLDRIAPIDFDATEGIKVLLYGQSGSGKTTFWGTFPEPILAVICSGGFRPGELRSVDTPANKERIRQVVLHESSELGTIVEAQRGGQIQFATVVLDHVSGLQDLTLKEILGLEELPAQKGWGVASQQQWGQSTAQCKEYLRGLLGLACNVVIIGQERTFGGREDGMDSELIKPTVGVSVTPSLAGWLNPACDYVIQMFKRPRFRSVRTTIGGQEHVTEQRGEGVDYCARCEPHDVFMTKFRVPRGQAIPRVIVDPSYEKVMDVIRGRYSEPAVEAATSKPPPQKAPVKTTLRSSK